MLSIVIQAGGESRRMGRNKALIPFLGKPLIARVVERMSRVGDELLVTTNQPVELEFLGLPLFPDLLPGRGALGGLYTALSAAAEAFVAVVACDMPFASPEVIHHLFERLQETGADVAIPKTQDGFEPLHAVYRREKCLPAVKAALEDGQQRMISWFGEVSVLTIPAEDLVALDPRGVVFLNLNTPEDWAQAETLALDNP